ncbi:MAG: glycosyltransferase [Akkermansiaceae bacterium]|nr:glycosyltransferase [Verrucomicrobiales bacterium]
MNPETITHIVPALPPQIDGVGDYALHLARRLRSDHGINSRFIVCDPDWNGPSRLEDFVVRRLRLRNEAGIWSLLAAVKENPAVLLHYVGYGYHKRGVPIWLYRGIHSWLAEQNGNRKQFSTVFHELWASSSKPWKSEFYLRLVQKWIVEGLHRRSELSITSTRRMQTLLEGIQPHKTMWLPIPSNVPMVERPQFGNGRTARLRVAIFGQYWSRSATVKAHANLLRALDQKKLLGSAMLIGKGLAVNGAMTEDLALLRKCVAPDRIKIVGELSPENISHSLNGADLFLSPYRGELACKSGAFMAALATGCPAVLRDGENAAPLREGEHFLASDDTPSSVERFERAVAEGQLERIARAGRLWYERHADWKVIAQNYQEALASPHRSERSRGIPAPVFSLVPNRGEKIVCQPVKS